MYLQPFYVIRPESYRIWWNYARLWLLRRSRSFKVTDFGTNRKVICYFLLVINSNLPPILHRFWDIALDRSKIAIFCYPLRFNPPPEGFPWDDLHKIFIERSLMASIPNGVKTLPKISIAWVGSRTLQTIDRRQTEGRTMTYSEREREFTFANKIGQHLTE